MKETFSITGMSCQHCVKRVEDGLNTLPGIQKVKINLKKESGTVKFDEEKTSVEEIRQNIIATGYGAEVTGK